MQHSDQPFAELAQAKAAISAMEKSTSIANFEEQWKEFLRRIERSWSKAQAHFGKSPKWNGWQGKIAQQRKTDSLLSYLVNARGAEEHTVNEITDHAPGGFSINAAKGNSLYIERMEIINDVVVNLQSPQKLRIEFFPARMRLLPITNRGKRYELPTSHPGKQIDPNNVIAISIAALSFYEKVLADAEAKFV